LGYDHVFTEPERYRWRAIAFFGVGRMPYTKCPNCRKIQQVMPKLMNKDIGCMGERCNKSFKAEEYRLHSGRASKVVFWFTIGFAVFLLGRWVWNNSSYILATLP